MTQGRVALVDADNYEWLSQWKWCYRQGYAVRSVKRKGRNQTILMHRQIAAARPEEDVDHRNGNGLDNRCRNLRFCDQGLNNRNNSVRKDCQSGYKGVGLTDSGSYRMRIWNGTKEVTLYFKTARQAAMAYDIWAKELFGDFARLNFPEGIHG